MVDQELAKWFLGRVRMDVFGDSLFGVVYYSKSAEEAIQLAQAAFERVKKSADFQLYFRIPPEQRPEWPTDEDEFLSGNLSKITEWFATLKHRRNEAESARLLRANRLESPSLPWRSLSNKTLVDVLQLVTKEIPREHPWHNAVKESC